MLYRTPSVIADASRLVEASLDDGDTQTARSLLDDDAFLHSKVLHYTSYCLKSASQMLHAISVLHAISSFSSLAQATSISDLYIMAVSGGLLDSITLRDALLAVKRMDSGSLIALLDQIMSLRLDDSSLQTELVANQGELKFLLQSNGESLIRSGHDARNQTIRTTVVAQKVELSKRRAALSKVESTYTKLVDHVHEALKSHLEGNIISPQDLFLNEVFFYDLRSPHRELFSPRPRFAIERALFIPHDYLGCSCCGTSAEGLSMTQPATAILYQLYLESGALINDFDLWSAFYAIVGGEDGQDCDEAHAL